LSLKKVASFLLAERRKERCLIEIIPAGEFVTYGLGVFLMKMRKPATAGARTTVT